MLGGVTNASTTIRPAPVVDGRAAVPAGTTSSSAPARSPNRALADALAPLGIPVDVIGGAPTVAAEPTLPGDRPGHAAVF